MHVFPGLPHHLRPAIYKPGRRGGFTALEEKCRSVDDQEWSTVQVSVREKIYMHVTTTHPGIEIY